MSALVAAARSGDSIPEHRQARSSAVTVWELLCRRATATPDLPYLDIADRSGRWHTVSFGLLRAQAGTLAGWLRTNHGIGSGDRVALAPRNDLESVQALFGALAAGASVLLLNPDDPAERLARQLSARAPRLVLGDLGGATPVPVTATAAPDGPAPAGDDHRPTGLEPALMFNTSGSTDLPKTVCQPHQAVLTNAVAFGRHHRLQPGQRVLGFLPISHANAVHTNLMAPLATGAHSILLPGLEPFTLPGHIERIDPRLVSMVPSAVEALLTIWRRPRLPRSLTHVLSAAAPLAAATCRRFTDLTGLPVTQGYGLTETTNFSTTLPPTIGAEAYRRLMLEADTPSVGVAFAGTDVFVSAEDGTPLPPAAVGEICMRGPSLMTGYLDDDAATAAAFAGGRFHSGDLGYAVEDPEVGRVFVLTGRLKNIAKVRGEQVSLEEVEHALCSVSGLRDAGCVTEPHRVDGERLVAAVVVDRGAGELPDRATVLHELRLRLPAIALPRTIVVLERIPRTATGKIVRLELGRLIEQAVAGAAVLR